VDPIKDGVNWYVYCRNNPLRYVDPNGLKEISTLGLNFIASYESFSSTIYNDVGGYQTIGYGHKLTNQEINNGKYKNGISNDDALQLLKQDAQFIVDGINKYTNDGENLSQNEFDALASLGFNIGRSALLNSNLFDTILNGDPMDIIQALKDDPNFDNISDELWANLDQYIQAIKDGFLEWNKVNGEEVEGLTNRRSDEIEMFFFNDYSVGSMSYY
jgi:lysozyme